MNKIKGVKDESLGVSKKATLNKGNIIREGVNLTSDCYLGKRSYISGPNTSINSAWIGRYC
jgi:UDP-3-O-[3-hydroxymyristoyl] glucosamine N-acyltransferase